MRFECSSTTVSEYNTMLNAIHASENGTFFEVAARLWYTTPDSHRTVMVEYQITTREGRKMAENPKEPDYLTAYEVKNEQDDSVSHELCSNETAGYLPFFNLREIMLNYAQSLADNLLLDTSETRTEPKPSLYRAIIQNLPTEPVADSFGYILNLPWTNGSEILCRTEESANTIADLLDAMGYTAHTSYYDPAEDEKAGETDRLTGWWEVDVD